MNAASLFFRGSVEIIIRAKISGAVKNEFTLLLPRCFKKVIVMLD